VKKFYKCLWLAAAAAALLLLAPPTGHIAPAIAQSQPKVVMGVVDFELIMKESKAGKSVKSQYDKQISAFNAKLEQKRKAFKDEARKLNAKQSTLPGDEFKRKVGELDAQRKATEKSLVQAKQALDIKLTTAVGQIRSTLLEIVAEIAKKRALTLVLTKSHIIVSADAYDLTDESMKKLDATLPSVNFMGAN
jgi:outer membrane protein